MNVKLTGNTTNQTKKDQECIGALKKKSYE